MSNKELQNKIKILKDIIKVMKKQKQNLDNYTYKILKENERLQRENKELKRLVLKIDKKEILKELLNK